MQIIKVGFVSEEKNKGCETAPNLILSLLKEIGTSEKGRLLDVSALNFEEIHVDSQNLDEANHLIFENSKEIFEKHGRALFIGGDHSISYSIASAFKKTQENPLLIIFDAHADCIRAGTLSRNWIRKLVDNSFYPSHIVLISSRNIFEEEMKFIKDKGITWIKMDILSEEIAEVCDIVMERARNSGGFYVSIDIDSVDPAFAPGTNLIEPGGLSSRDLIYFIKRLSLLENFRGADIVNINPSKDVNEMTVKLGAKILGEMI